MKTNKIPSVLLCLLLFSLPLAVTAEEIVTEVLVVIKRDEVLAFSGPENRWISHSLKQNERVRLKKSQGNVAVVVTDRHIMGFSVFSGRWSVIDLMMNEAIREVRAEGNVAIVKTERRVFGFNAHTGNWVEAK